MSESDLDRARAAHSALKDFFAAHPKGRLDRAALDDAHGPCRAAATAVSDDECRRARSIANDRWPTRPRHLEVSGMARLAVGLVRHAVNALERLDASQLADAAKREDELDAALRAVLRELITSMIEGPRTISSCLDMLFVAKSFERIGDHATNVFEHVIYAVKGDDLRHAPPFSS